MRFFIFFFLMLLFISCGGKQEQAAKIINKSEFSTVQKQSKVVFLKSNVKRKIDDWQEYASVNDFLNQYRSISPNEALNNSKELNDLVQVMKDSVKPNFLESNSFNARINLLHNETLRLFDMSAISSIKSEEVNEQVTKVIEAFSSVNSKINTLVLRADLDAQVNDPKFNRLKKDSLMPDNIQKLEVKNSQESVKDIRIRMAKEQQKGKKDTRFKQVKLNKDVKKKKN